MVFNLYVHQSYISVLNTFYDSMIPSIFCAACQGAIFVSNVWLSQIESRIYTVPNWTNQSAVLRGPTWQQRFTVARQRIKLEIHHRPLLWVSACWHKCDWNGLQLCRRKRQCTLSLGSLCHQMKHHPIPIVYPTRHSQCTQHHPTACSQLQGNASTRSLPSYTVIQNHWSNAPCVHQWSHHTCCPQCRTWPWPSASTRPFE